MKIIFNAGGKIDSHNCEKERFFTTAYCWYEGEDLTRKRSKKEKPKKAEMQLRKLLSQNGRHKVLLPALLHFFFSFQKMPQEPSVVGDVRSLLDETREVLEKMMPQEEFFDFLSSHALPDLKKQVGKHMLEVLQTIVRVLHIQCEVSQVKAMH